MRTKILFTLLLALAIFSISNSQPVWASEQTAEMTQATAAQILQDIQGEVVSVEPSEIPGFYRVAMKIQDKVIPLYLDNSGTFLISGNIIDLKQRKNLTEEHFRQLNPAALDKIPLDDALTLGAADAPTQIIVFTDPHCPFCSQLHQVLLEAVKADPKLAFRIKLLALKQGSYEIAKSIICNRSLEQLEMAFSGATVPVTDCETDAINNNLALAQSLGINGTPTLILPNGQIAPGYRPLDELQKLIEENSVAGK